MTRFSPCRVSDPAAFGRVGLLVGGDSAEREVSLDGGEAVSGALARKGVRFECHDGTAALFDAIQANRIDRVFNLMHGPGGEDGAIQGALQLMKVPVTGSGVLGSALSMDKLRSKWMLERLGISTAPCESFEAGDEDYGRAVEKFGLPVFVKPTGLGSSIGVSRVTEAGALAGAFRLALQYGDQVIVEPEIVGAEYFAGILGRKVLPLIRIETPREFYDYEAKYHSDETRYFCPSGLDPQLEQELRAQSMLAFEGLGASGWGRVDFILDGNDRAWFLEVNTVPGMTGHSLVPQAAEVAGVGFDELVWRILETSL